MEMKLSDSFKQSESQSEPKLELKVKVYNINFKENLPILRKSLALFAYSKFSEYVRMGDAERHSDSIGYALDKCISENLLTDYFEKLKREDRGMIFGEYSREDDIRVQREEAFEDGEIAGTQATKIANAKNLLQMNILNPEQISQAVSLPLEQVLALKEELEHESLAR